MFFFLYTVYYLEYCVAKFEETLKCDLTKAESIFGSVSIPL